MDDTQKTKEQLLAEFDELRRGMAALETAAIEHRRAEQRLMKEARIAETALRTSEATSQALLESAPEGILLIDASGRSTEPPSGSPESPPTFAPLHVRLPASTRRSA